MNDESDEERSVAFELKSESQTAKLGNALGTALVPGMVVALNGTLGAGKTRLTQAIGSSLGIPAGEVVSPTFTICVPHEGRLPFLHLDAYRISELEEVDELGLDELVENGVVLIVEWAERIESCLPPVDLQITITATGDTSRLFRMEAKSEQGTKLISGLRGNFEVTVGS